MAEPPAARPHLFVPDRSENQEFRRRGGGGTKPREVAWRDHGQGIQQNALDSLAEQDQVREEFDFVQLKALGVVLTISGSPGFPLSLDSLERFSTHKAARRPKWMLLSVTPETDDRAESAMVWVSDAYRTAFLRLFEDYLTKTTDKGNPKNQPLIANMARIRAAVLDDLWQSDGDPPRHGEHWWELWLRPEPDAISQVQNYAERFELRLAPKQMRFDGRHVVWIRGSWQQLLALPFTAVPLAELRHPQFADTVEDLDREDQGTLAEDLVGRVKPSPDGSPAVCLLDTGVRRSHVLLEPSLAATDVHTVVGNPAGDIAGHGTQMAGLALHGPIEELLLSSTIVQLRHRLESVKFLPDSRAPNHDPLNYGVVSAEAVALPEVAAPERGRAYCLTVTSPADRPGAPSLWSAAVDALAAGTDIGRSPKGIELLGPPDPSAARLIVVSAGNVDSYSNDYRENCDLSPIADPGQAWNVLTVGASTQLTDLPSDPSFAGWQVLGDVGDISPHSRTGMTAGGLGWPIKPDICMEGGNVLADQHNDFEPGHPLLSLRTTHLRDDSALGSANATSAAAAQAARLAAMTMARYPSYWPETVRGLMTHSAEWTPPMRSAVEAETGLKKRRTLLTRFGWGIPDERQLLDSSRNAVTMVVQDEFVPFTGADYKMRNFRLHQLPWPCDALLGLGGADVELRVTLSYFIEPSAGRRGWRNRYAYASHGLRFDLRRPNETTPDFVRRVNREAALDEDGGSSGSGAGNWTLGPDQRSKGSLHQDMWAGDGPHLATTGGVLAVHAVGGWWKNNKRKDRVDLPIRYALLISLRTRAESVDLYTPIATDLEVPIEAAAIEV